MLVTYLNDIISETIPVSSGVPQGFLLGPLLFIKYVYNIRPNTTQRRSVEKVPINDWQASVTLILLVFHRLDLAS